MRVREWVREWVGGGLAGDLPATRNAIVVIERGLTLS